MAEMASAGGSSFSYGNAIPVQSEKIPVTARGDTQSSGSALANTTFPDAGMTDFAVFDSGSVPDPVRTRRVALQSVTDVAGTWSRIYVTATAPEPIVTGNGDGVILWNGAAKAAVGIRYKSLANNDYHHIDAVQFEKSQTNNQPRVYEEPRTLNIKMRADRVNFAQNPGWQIAPGAGLTSNGTMTTETIIKRSGVRSVRVQATATSNVSFTVGGTIELVKDAAYTWSVWVFPLTDLMIDPYFWYLQETAGASRVFARGAMSSGLMQLYGGRWNRVRGTGRTYADNTQFSKLVIRAPRDNFNTQYITTAPLIVDQILVEPGTELRDYFDGDFTSVDYLWENGSFNGTTGSRSHYYRMRRAKQYRIDEIIKKNVPVGESYRITYASVPAGLS